MGCCIAPVELPLQVYPEFIEGLRSSFIPVLSNLAVDSQYKKSAPDQDAFVYDNYESLLNFYQLNDLPFITLNYLGQIKPCFQIIAKLYN